MSLTSTVLFDLPQREIASLITERMSRASAVSIVTGFATPGGLAALSGPIKAQPAKLAVLVLGAATYPGFEALDDLLLAGVPPDRLYVHFGHSCQTGTPKNPFARYHPMLHSKVYYMELPGGNACAFVGSHNVTSYALTGLNGEAAVMLEGFANSPEFEKIRKHIDAAKSQATRYSSGMKEAYAWWMREFIDGFRAEMKIPQDWTTIRTILLFASAAQGERPKTGDYLYFEIPAGIEQIENLKTETHLYLFDTLPPDPWQALDTALSSPARYTCKTLGADNKQGNQALLANWHIVEAPLPELRRVPSGTYQPTTPPGKQQVRAEVETADIVPYEYQFEREKIGWDPQFATDSSIHPPREIRNEIALKEARGDNRARDGWKLVTGLAPRTGTALEKDQAALKLASPESGSFILVSLRRRRIDKRAVR